MLPAPARRGAVVSLPPFGEQRVRGFDAAGDEVTAPDTFSAVAASLILHIRSLLRELAPESDDLALATIILGAVAPVVVRRLCEQEVELAQQQPRRTACSKASSALRRSA
jgi:hypothetical protein